MSLSNIHEDIDHIYPHIRRLFTFKKIIYMYYTAFNALLL